MEPLNAVALAVILEKRPNARRSSGESYTCDSSPDEDATTGGNVDVARPGCFAASTVPRGNGRVPGDGEWGGVSGVGRLVMNVLLLVKAIIINMLC